MFCPKCGAAVYEGEGLCPLCGASLIPNEAPEEELSPFARLLGADGEPEAEAPPPAAASEEPSAPPPPEPYGSVPDFSPPGPPPEAPRKKRAGLFIGLGAAALLIVAAVFAVPAIVQALSPAAFVAASLGRTLDAVSAPFRDLDLGEVFSAVGKDPTASEFSFHTDLGLSGAGRDGLTLLVESDPKSQTLALDMALSAGDGPFLTLRSSLEDDLFCFASPELLGDAWYSLHTRTIGADFNGSVLCTGGNAMAEDAGFDLFAPDEAGISAETRAALAALSKEYGAAVTVEKAGTDVPVTADWSLTGDLYRLTFPAADLRAYSRELLYAMADDEVFRAAYLRGLYGDYYSYSGDEWDAHSDEAYDRIDAWTEGIRNDLTMDFYISDKLVRRVKADFAYDAYDGATGLSLDVVFGKENSVADALSVRFTIDDAYGERITFDLDSVGRHTGADGVYDDATSLSISKGNVSALLFQSSTAYDARSGDFPFTLTVPNDYDSGSEWAIEGTVLIDPKAKTFSAALENELSVDYTVLNFSTSWSVSPLKEFTVHPNEPTPFFSMTEEEYAAFQQTLWNNAISLLGTPY